MKHHEDGPSSLPKRKLCPGSKGLEKDLPELPGNETQESGNNCHEAMETGDITGLSDTEVANIEKAKEVEEQRILSLCDKFGEPISDNREILLTTLDKELEVLNFGTADRVIIFKDVALIIDYKFGFNKIGSDSIQLLNYAVAVHQRYGIDNVYCCVIQPTISNYPIIEYNKEGLEDGLDDIQEIIINANDPYAPIVPGEAQCRYCKAKFICPKIKQNKIALNKITDLSTLSDSDISDNYKQWQVLKSIGSDIEKEVKSRLKKSEKVNDLYLDIKKGNREISDIAGVAGRLGDLLTPQEILSKCKISMSGLEKIAVPKIQASAEEKTTIKAAKIQLSEMIEEFISRGNDKQSIKIKTEK